MKVKLAEENEVGAEALKEVDFFGRPVVLLRQNGRIKGYLNVCTHLGGPLGLRGNELRCAWHGACFEAGTGAATCPPAPRGSRLIALPLRVEAGQVYYVYDE